MKPQPAEITYFFKDVYTETLDVIKVSFLKMKDRIIKYGNNLKVSASNLKIVLVSVVSFVTMFLGFFRSIWATMVFGWDLTLFLANLILSPILTIVFSAFHIVAMAFVMLGIMIFYGCVSLADFIMRKVKRLSNGCPSCQAKFDIPTYVCPQCGALHTKLVPSKYGIFNRTCQCGHILPTTFFNGRQTLSGVCPDCGKPLTNSGAHTEVWIPVIGGASSGKTCYITMAINEIEKKYKDGNLVKFQYIKNIHEDREDMFENYTNILKKGGRLPKTDATADNMRMMYYQFNLEAVGEITGNFISLCDMPGEVFKSENKVDFAQQGLKNIDGLVLLVDPLSIPAFREEFLNENEGVDIYAYGASDFEINDVATTLTDTLENMLGKKVGEFKKPAAIVFTKLDIPGLEEKIGETAVDEYLKNFADGAKDKPTREEARNHVCEQFLLQYEAADFVQTLKMKFKNMNYFACAPLGHNENGSPFTPVNVEDGLMWIIDENCPTLRAESLGKKKNTNSIDKKKEKWEKKAQAQHEKKEKILALSDNELVELTFGKGEKVTYRRLGIMDYKGRSFAMMHPLSLDGEDQERVCQVFEVKEKKGEILYTRAENYLETLIIGKYNKNII